MKQNIETALSSALKAIDTLKATIAADTSVTLNLELTREEANLLYGIMQMDISIPAELKLRVPYPSLRTSEALMAKVRNALDR